ncbi:MAG TPA: mechanosensitive ion channel domain-containing protein [Stellaceae bacterium]|nr:mechanosensitive ion channel domain-containing protein [Stellaceae bacterium]
MAVDSLAISAAAQAPSSLRPLSDYAAGWADSVTQAGKTIGDLAIDVLKVPDRLAQAARLLTGDGALGTPADVLLPFVLLLACASAVAYLVFLALAPQRRHLSASAPPAALPFMLAFLRAALVDLAPPAAYLAVASAGNALLFSLHGLIFNGTDTFRAIASMVISTSSIAWFAAVLLSLPLGVGRPGLRLSPLSDDEASSLRHFIRRVVFFVAASWVVASGLYYAWIGEGLPRLIMVSAGVIACAMCVSGVVRTGRSLVGFGRVWAGLAIVAAVGLTAIWVVSLLSGGYPPFDELLLTVLILVGVPALDGMAALVMERLRHRLEIRHVRSRTIFVPSSNPDEEILEGVEQPIGEAERQAIREEIVHSTTALAGVAQWTLRWFLTVIALLLIAQAWGLDLAVLLGPSGARTWLGGITEAGLTLLAGWCGWCLFEAALAVYLSREEGGAQSRARTIQPLLHAIGRLVIGAVATMSALSSLGVNIAPLIASAGVIGIAVGFGAQTLVRDLFSGASYLIEDVFRVGDYIEGGSAKGVVERITFRTVALRHQNGPLFFVPYGSLGVVRNNSRDWVIDKFEIPLPTTVSSEQIRRMVKKIGQEMAEEPELTKLIVQPLKAKLYRIEPGVKVFRCKFQTLPERQFELRTESYRRIESALGEAGIPFADSLHTVRVNIGQTEPPLAAVA